MFFFYLPVSSFQLYKVKSYRNRSAQHFQCFLSTLHWELATSQPPTFTPSSSLCNSSSNIFSSNSRTFFCSTLQQTPNHRQSCFKLKLKAPFFKLLNNLDIFNNNSSSNNNSITTNKNERWTELPNRRWPNKTIKTTKTTTTNTSDKSVLCSTTCHWLSRASNRFLSQTSQDLKWRQTQQQRQHLRRRHRRLLLCRLLLLLLVSLRTLPITLNKIRLEELTCRRTKTSISKNLTDLQKNLSKEESNSVIIYTIQILFWWL